MLEKEVKTLVAQCHNKKAQKNIQKQNINFYAVDYRQTVNLKTQQPGQQSQCCKTRKPD